MSANLNLEMRINAHTSGLTTGLNQSTAAVNRFERSTISSFGRMKNAVIALNQNRAGYAEFKKRK